VSYTLGRKEALGAIGTGVVTAALAPNLAISAFAQEQTGLTIYHPKTGHNMSGPLLDFWREHQNGLLVGDPITEAIEFPKTGTVMQYFEKAGLYYQPGKDETVRLENLGEQSIPKDRQARERRVGIHPEYFTKYSDLIGDPISHVDQNTSSRTQVFRNLALREHFFESVPLKDDHGKIDINANLTDDPFRNFRLVQDLFPKLLWPGQVEVLSLGKVAAESRGFLTTPTKPREGALVYTPGLWDKVKRVVVTLSTQKLAAFEGDLKVMETKVSTGGDPYNQYKGEDFRTPTGEFAVLDKSPNTTYVSFPGSVRSYTVRGVPFNMRFTNEQHFIHGTTWHDSFGIARSAGCVNLNNDDAKWVYDWANHGTPVRVVDQPI
jgi:hypothetical protein